MPDLSGLQETLEGPARRLLKRLVAPRPQGGEPEPGLAVTADGEHAVAVTESWVSDAAALGASFPAGAALEAFALETDEEPLNLLGRPAVAVPGASPRGALAAACGLAEAGRRTAVFLAGNDLAGAQDLLARAAERRLPLVVHLACRGASASTVGSDHGPFHGAGGSGAVRLFAADAQEAVDFALVGHRLAEEALLPVLVAMDGTETGLGLQDLYLPTPGLVRRYLGEPGATVHPSGAAQELLYGRHRRRLPKGHDPERPLLAGPALGPETWALAAAGRRAYLDHGVAERLEAAFERFAAVTGRRHGLLSAHRTQGMTAGAHLILVAVGSAVATAEAAADRLRGAGLKVGVVGLRSLSPFPAARLAEELAGARAVVVLERTEAPLAGEGPLSARVRSALASLAERKMPRLTTAFYGLGGMPLEAADLAALAREALEKKGDGKASGSWRSSVWLGVDFAPEEVADPKRQVVLDALAREYPQAARLGLKGMGNGKKKKKRDRVGKSDGEESNFSDLRPEGAVTVGLPASGGLMEELAAVVHRALGVHLRGRRGTASASHGSTAAADGNGHGSGSHSLNWNLLTWAPEAFGDPGSAVPADLRLVSLETLSAHGTSGGWQPWQPLAPGGALLVDGARGVEGEELWKMLPPALVREAAEGGLRLFTCPRPGAAENGGRSLSPERLLGSVLGTLEACGEMSGPHRKLLDARREILQRAGAGSEDLDRRMEAFTAGLDGVRELEAPDASAVPAAGVVSPEPPVPAELRRLARTDSELDSLPRFWDQVGVLYRRGEESELVPDPYLAAGAVPPLSSAFRSFAPGRDMLPAFDPAPCTGCGECWSVCPHGALDPLALGPDALIDAGMERARAAGAAVDTLRMARSRLVKALASELAATDGGELGPMLDRAFGAATAKMPLSEDREASLEEAFAGVREQLARLPVGRTEPFFDAGEGSETAGEIFSLAVDADACRACGLCLEVCEPEALTAVADSPRRTAAAREIAELVDDLPAPSEETVERARRHPEVGPVAGALLDREARRTVAPCEGAEPGAGDALVLRQLLASAARHLRPRRQRRLEELEELQEELAAAIHRGMAHALPESDLSALALGLDAVERPDADLAEIISRVEGAFDDERVDVPRLRRLVAVAREVADLRQRMAGGALTGVGHRPGRAPFGLVLGPGPAQGWAAAFPWNPFAVPVTADTVGETAELARGLAAGRLQEVLEEARLMSRARQELEVAAGTGATPARRRGQEPGPRRIEELGAEDLASCPPVLVVVSEEAATSGSLEGLLDLLATDLPVKLLVLSEARLPGLERTGAGPRMDVGLLALATRRRAVVAQTSPAVPEHLERSLEAALASSGPALLRLHAPSPARHGFAPERTRERLEAAVATRVLPLYLARPGEDGVRRLDLSGNPDPDADPGVPWSQGLTPAHFALGEERSRGHLSPLGPSSATEEAPAPTPLREWLELAPEERAGATPTVEAEDRAWAVSPALARAAAECAATWESLRHLAREGALEAEERPAGAGDLEAGQLETLEVRHRAEVERLRTEYESRLAAARSELQVEMARKVRGRLLELARRGAGMQDTAVAREPASAEDAGEVPS